MPNRYTERERGLALPHSPLPLQVRNPRLHGNGLVVFFVGAVVCGAAFVVFVPSPPSPAAFGAEVLVSGELETGSSIRGIL